MDDEQRLIDTPEIGGLGKDVRVKWIRAGLRALVSLAAALLLAGLFSPASAEPPAGSPVAVNGLLRVCGTKLCNKHGRPIQLRGMSTHGLQWYSQCVNRKSLDALATAWKADVIRISMYIQEGGYVTDPRGFTDRVHAIIEQATARGLYAIVDWHMLNPGDPHYNFARAKVFFDEMARRHKDKINVIYEVANEPNNDPAGYPATWTKVPVTWARIRAYHQKIVPVIRSQDSNGIILLGTAGWGSLGISDGRNETEVISNPVTFGNVMYTMHIYAASHGSIYLEALRRAAVRLPMFVTEFGTQQASGDGANNFAQSQRYLDLMAQQKISWTSWNYSDDERSGAAFLPGTCPSGDFAGLTRLKPAGKWIRARVSSADNFPVQ